MSDSHYKLVDQQQMTGLGDYQRLFIKAVEKKDWLVAPEIMKELGKRSLK